METTVAVNLTTIPKAYNLLESRKGIIEKRM
jgi:hypothetical protein